MEIKRVGVLSTAKILGALYAALGLLIGLLYACAFLAVGVGGLVESDAGLFGIGVGGFFLILCLSPIIYGLIGFIAGAIAAVLYNVLAGVIGGIELELAEKI